jgi:hypothetical protein
VTVCSSFSLLACLQKAAAEGKADKFKRKTAQEIQQLEVPLYCFFSCFSLSSLPKFSSSFLPLLYAHHYSTTFLSSLTPPPPASLTSSLSLSSSSSHPLLSLPLSSLSPSLSSLSFSSTH